MTYKLSGGEKSWYPWPPVLAMQPQLLLLDEPTTGLDDTTRHRLIHILQSLDISYLIVSHEHEFLEHTVRECCHVHTTFCETLPIKQRGSLIRKQSRFLPGYRNGCYFVEI